MSTWIYKQTETEVYTVGFYDPAGIFIPESDHENRVKAAERVSYLNGGTESYRDLLRKAAAWDALIAAHNESGLEPRCRICCKDEAECDGCFDGDCFEFDPSIFLKEPEREVADEKANL